MDDEEVFIWDYPEPDRARLILRKAREEEEAIEEFEPIELDDDEEMEPLSPLYQYLVRNRMMDEFTNFTSFGVEAIWRLFAPALAAERHRGPRPKSSANGSSALPDVDAYGPGHQSHWKTVES